MLDEAAIINDRVQRRDRAWPETRANAGGRCRTADFTSSESASVPIDHGTDGGGSRAGRTLSAALFEARRAAHDRRPGALSPDRIDRTRGEHSLSDARSRQRHLVAVRQLAPR